MKTLLSLLLLLLFCSWKTVAREAENLCFGRPACLENLPNNEVLKLFHDSDGFVWIATSGGLYCTDGYELKEYRSNIYRKELISDNNVRCMAEDDDKHLYIGTG